MMRMPAGRGDVGGGGAWGQWPWRPWRALLLLSRLGQEAREWESEGKESEAMRRAPAAAGWLRLGGRRMGQDGENGNRHVGPTATWTPRQRNRRPKPSDGQSRTVLIVGWPKIPGFAIRWLKPNRDQS